jgi:hypothetical protein
MASDGLHILDEDGLLIEANDAFLNMLGYGPAAIGKVHHFCRGFAETCVRDD